MLHIVMHEQNLAILKGLVCVAWADGRVADEEMDVIEGLLGAFLASPSEAHEIRLFAKSPRTLEEVPLTDLSHTDRRMLLHQAVLVSFADGQQTAKEVSLLTQLADQLRIPADEARGILESGADHAHRMLHLLQKA